VYPFYVSRARTRACGTGALAQFDEIVLCEALFDALTFCQAGFHNVTASYGVTGFTPDHLYIEVTLEDIDEANRLTPRGAGAQPGRTAAADTAPARLVAGMVVERSTSLELARKDVRSSLRRRATSSSIS
jgi:hypothetical protein